MTVRLASILTAWRDRIAALAPSTAIADDDVYRVQIGTRHWHLGSRAVLLTCEPGQRLASLRSCSDWEATVALEVYYLDTPPEDEDSSAYLRAVEDAEQLVADLYDWATSGDGQDLGILAVEPSAASIAGGEGLLLVARAIRFVYRGD